MVFDPNAQGVEIEIDEPGAVQVQVRQTASVVDVLVFTELEIPALIAPVLIESPMYPTPEVFSPVLPVPVLEVPVAQGIPGATGLTGPAGAAADGSDIPDLATYFENGLV